MSDIQLRWLTVETHVTGEQVRAYAQENQLSMMDAKERLQDRMGPVLQYRKVGPYDRAVWYDVPHVKEYRNKDEQTI